MLEFTVEKYYLVKLLKIQSNHNNVRTTEIVGYAPHLPTISVPFVLFGKGLSAENSLRLIRTTEVKATTVNTPEDISFITANSSYNILILDEVPASDVEDFIDSTVSKGVSAVDQFMAKLDLVEPKVFN